MLAPNTELPSQSHRCASTGPFPRSTDSVPHPSSGHSLRRRIRRSIQFSMEWGSRRWSATFAEWSAGSGREDLTPRTTVRAVGDPEYARRFAADAHRAAVIDSVDGRVRHAPTGAIAFPQLGGRELRLCGFDVAVG